MIEILKKIPVADPDIGPLEKKYINEVIDSRWISSTGPKVAEFEKAFAKYVKTKYALAVSSGTAALDLALLALGISTDDEVIIPTFTFAATANTVVHQGAKPVFVDSSDEDWNIDCLKIEAAITPKTKAIMAVHIYGIPAAMDKIMKIAKKHKLFVIEDAAEALGARYENQMAGSIGNIGCFSFYANKIITTGEGGMCVTNDKKLYEKMKMYYSHGSRSSKSIYYYHPVVGHNFRMTSLQAAIGLAQLERIDSFIKARNGHEKLYRQLLKGVSGIKFSPKPQKITPVDWMHSILVLGQKNTSRDKLMAELKKRNIETRPFFYPISKMPPYINLQAGPFSVAEKLARTGLNLPSGVNLSAGQITFVANAIKKILEA